MDIIKNRIGVVVVNFNRLELTKKCVGDLLLQTNKNFDLFIFDQNSNENGTIDFLDECEKKNIVVIRNNKNVPLNYIWNDFKNQTNCEFLCFLNNDIELSNKFIDDNINVFKAEPNVGFVIHVTNNPEYLKTKNKLVYSVLKPPYYQGWDFTIRRKIMPEIPKELLIFGGDDYIFAKGVRFGYDVALIYSSPIIHHSSKTRAIIPNIHETHMKDAKFFYDVLAKENLQQLNITTNVGLCYREPAPNMKIENNYE